MTTMSAKWAKYCAVSLDQYTLMALLQIVARLFDIVKPDYAVFGEKDYQQLLIINSLIERQGIDNNYCFCSNCERVKMAIAISTRNNYLNSEDRV